MCVHVCVTNPTGSGQNLQTENCGMNACPVDCVMGDWEAWGLCDASCGNGSTHRSRKVVTFPTFGGQVCGQPVEEKTCENGLCPIHCELSEWSEWSDCSITCSSEGSPGTAKRLRKVIQHQNALGDSCVGDLQQTISCSRTQCPVDCQLFDWSEWSDCSTSCGPGIAERRRERSIMAQYGGRDCANETYQKKYCAMDTCPEDCQWSDWQDWRACSVTCGNGSSYRMRLVKTPMLHGGRECEGGYQQSRDCNAAFCPIHCKWDDWAQWTECSTTCGEGAEKRSREVKVMADHGGNPCNGSRYDTRDCDHSGCPIQCVWADWADWQSCSASCGSGKHSRSREKAVLAENGGADCSGPDAEVAACPELPACPVDCEWDDWSQWESCTVTCGSGFVRRNRIRKIYEKDGGHTCFGTEDDEQAPCLVFSESPFH